MNRTEIAEIVEQTRHHVVERYVFRDIGARLGQLLAERAAGGHYDVTSADTLAALVTEDLQSLNGDLHLRLRYHPDGLADLPDEEADREYWARTAALHMGGVARVERLPGNVALLDLSPYLFPAPFAGDAILAAMRLVAQAEALLVDLRGNRGGDPATVALTCSYLFDEPTRLSALHNRDDTVEQWSTLAYVPGPRFGGTKPVFVLTSADTFSGGEALSYDLQQHGRATVVGERTRGGAHPRAGFRVHPHLDVTVPLARPVHPVSGTNWESVGVAPDVEVPADDAFPVAYRAALEHVCGLGGPAADEARQTLATLPRSTGVETPALPTPA